MIHTIGCCDSGMGGIQIVMALKKSYPDLNIVFLADQSHVPYGDKSKEELMEYIRNFLNKFREMKIHEVIVACNTLCANVVEDIRKEYLDLHIYNIIEPTCTQLEGKEYSKIEVLATTKTVESHAYLHSLRKIYQEADILEIPAPELVPIIENGADPKQLKLAVEKLVHDDAQAIVLGCTHYPFIRGILENLKTCDIYDSNQAVIQLFQDETFCGEGNVMVYTSGNPKKMKETIQNLMHEELMVEHIEL